MNMPDFDNLSVRKIAELLSEQTENIMNSFGRWLSWVPLLVFLVCLYYLIGSIYGRRKKGLDNLAYLFLCGVLSFVVGIDAFYSFYGMDHGDYLAVKIVILLGNMAFVFLPAIFCLHVWTQVYYKTITTGTMVGYLIVPAFLCIFMIYQAVTGSWYETVWNFLILRPTTFSRILFIIYWFVMLIRSFLLCFQVFYQMPKHMRDSTFLIISALAVLAAQGALSAFINVNVTEDVSPLLYLLALIFVLNRTFRGFFRASAANVIATSREFVFANLSTLVLILSKKGRILEWNKKGASIGSFLPPRYLQPFEKYKEKLLTTGNGVVSPHDSNIITVTIKGEEYHLLITTHPIGEGRKQYGNLVEINEVTNVYSVLRYMESIAAIDQMTGLYNRNAYFEQAQLLMEKEYLPLTIVIGDVNNLKLINDSIGHLCGDRMLTCISDILRETAPENVFIARIGGDELVMLAPNMDSDVAEAFADRFQRRAEEIFDDEFGTPSISWGWATMYDPAEDYNEVFKRADEMMYARKRTHKESGRFILRGVLPRGNLPHREADLSSGRMDDRIGEMIGEQTEAPAVMSDQPAVSELEQPVVSDQPEQPAMPALSEQPVAAEHMGMSDQPVVSDQQAVSELEQPEMSDQAAAMEALIAADQAAAMDIPVAADPAVMSEQPVAADQAVMSEQPVAADQAVMSDQPEMMLESPSPSELIAKWPDPAAPEAPVAADPAQAMDIPVAADPAAAEACLPSEDSPSETNPQSGAPSEIPSRVDRKKSKKRWPWRRKNKNLPAEEPETPAPSTDEDALTAQETQYAGSVVVPSAQEVLTDSGSVVVPSAPEVMTDAGSDVVPSAPEVLTMTEPNACPAPEPPVQEPVRPPAGTLVKAKKPL
jgi:diguanylate cyclase (GGDEF)-like protein